MKDTSGGLKRSLITCSNNSNKKSLIDQQEHIYQQKSTEAAGKTSTRVVKDTQESGAPCEMRRTSTQNKG